MKKTFTKALSFAMALVMLLGMCSFASAEATVYNDVPFQNVTTDESDPNYYKDLWTAGIYNYKMVRNFPTLYEKDAWDAAQTASNVLESMDPEALTDANKAQLVTAKEAIEALSQHQVKPFEGINGQVLYIWGEDMPVTTENVQDGFSLTSYDNADFRPFLVPYLVADQSQAKGTLIILSGGGNTTRSNPNEAYKVAPAFFDLGYNCFILQRRVEPYNNEDIVMDLQRSIRYIKYHAAEWGLDLEGTLLGAAGFSGGAGNICTLMEKFYGDITPDQFDKDYVCDEIDAVNSDLNVAMPIYSGRVLETENPNIPHIFTAVGADDGIGGMNGYDKCWAMFQQMREIPGNNPEVHVYAQNGHGFGAGNAGTSSMSWIPTADMYMQKVMGLSEVNYEGEIPEEYVMMQDLVIDWFPIGTTTVTAYTNADQSKVLYTFFGWGDMIMVEGILINGHVADVTYDSVGYFKEDAPKMWELIDPAAWVPVQR